MSSAGAGRNLWLDMIRGCSALAVCLGHLRNAILADYSTLEHPGIAMKALYIFTGFGHQAVMVFFVLSGYFVGGAVLRSGAGFSWRNYLASRLAQLWVVLIPCLLITWIIGLAVGHYAPGVLSGANYDVWHSGPQAGEYSADIGTFLANVFFLQTIASPVFGLNGPLWSLANEFWYYILFPLLAVALGLAGTGKTFSRATAFVIAMMIAWWLPGEILYGFMIWIMGVAVFHLQRKMQSLSPAAARLTLITGLILFALSLGYSRSAALVKVIQIEPDLLAGLAFSFLCLALTYRPFPEIRWPRIAQAVRHLSEASYSLYLSHFPLVLLIAATVYGSGKLAPDGVALAQFFGWGILLAGAGSMVWWLFESRTPWVRTKVAAMMSPAWERN